MTSAARLLLLALTPRGWGETAFALHAARSLMTQGHQVLVFTRERTLPLFVGGSVPHQVVPEGGIAFLPLLLDVVVDDERPDAIVLCDIATTERALRLAGADPARVFEYGVPVI